MLEVNENLLYELNLLAYGAQVHSLYAAYQLRSAYNSDLPIFIEPMPASVDDRLTSTLSSTIKIAHFGHLTTHKNPGLMLDAFRELQNFIPNSEFHFVGEVDSSVERIVEEFFLKYPSLERSVVFHGYVAKPDLIKMISEHNLFLFLRNTSHGETSGLISDILSFGKVIIASDIGGFKDFPDEILFKVPLGISGFDLAQFIYKCIAIEKLEPNLSKYRVEYVSNHLAVDVWARNTSQNIELAAKKSISLQISNSTADIVDKNALAAILNANWKNPAIRRVGTDLTIYLKTEFTSGIQRVVKEFCGNIDLYLNPMEYCFFSINFDSQDSSISSVKHPLSSMGVELVSANISELDYLYLVDLNFHLPIEVIREERNRGLKVISVIHDILPHTNPEWFPPGTKENLFDPWLLNVLAISDVLVFHSQKQIRDFKLNFPDALQKSNIFCFPLGAQKSIPYKDKPLKDFIDLLFVSTIEPRKGLEDLLGAFMLLKKQGVPVKLTILGKQGWMVEKLVQSIEDSEFLGGDLIWIKSASEEELESLYESHKYLIVPSRGEGFGLPIVEGLMQSCLVIARDIPVFREHSTSNVRFFSGGPAELAETIKDAYDSDWKYDQKSKIRTFKNYVEDLVSILPRLNQT